MSLPVHLPTFRGEAPRVTPRALPNEMAQKAVNCRLLSGDLEAWKDVSTVYNLGKPGPTNTIARMGGYAWLSWAAGELNAGATNVDVAKVPIVGDTTELTVFTGAGAPQITNLQLATGGSGTPNGPYPIAAHALAVSAPTAAPNVSNTPGSSADTATPYKATTFSDWISGYIGGSYGSFRLLGGGGNSAFAGPVYQGEFQAPNTVWADSPTSLGFSQCARFTFNCSISPDVTNTDQAPNGYVQFLAANHIGGRLQLNFRDGGSISWTDRAGSGTVTTLAPGGTVNQHRGYMISLEALNQPGFDQTTGLTTFTASVTVTDAATSATLCTATGLPLTYGGETIEIGGTGGTSPDVQNVYFKDLSITVYTTPPTFIPVYSNYLYTYATSLLLESGPSPASSPTVQVDNGNSNLVTIPPPPAGQDVAEIFLYRAATGSSGSEYLLVENGAYADGGLPVCTVGGSANAIALTDAQAAGPAANAAYFFQAAAANTGAATIALDGTAALPLQDADGNPLSVGAIAANGYYTAVFERAFTTSVATAVTLGATPVATLALASTARVQLGQTVSDAAGAIAPGTTVMAFTPGPGNTVTLSAPLLASVAVGDLVTFGSNSNAYTLLPGWQYTDITPTGSLGTVLPTADFDPPPDDMQGVLALPNQVLAAFQPSGTLLLSARGQPQAYPLANQLATDSPIVGIGAIDANVLIVTQAHPYTAYGTDPGAYQMTKEDFVQGGVSKRSIAYLRGYGIVYASTDGIYAYAGQGQIRNLTERLFTLREWLPLNPASILGVVHQGLYFFWYDNGAAKAGYILDPSPDGFGLVELDFHAAAAYADPADDTLYLVIDHGTVAGGVTPAGNGLCQWEGAVTYRPLSWHSKLWQLPYPAAAALCRLRAANYSGLTLKLYADGSQFATLTPAGDMEFVVPPQVGRSLEVELSSGTANPGVQTLQLVERVEELA